ncbi:hypothetical protein MBLNU457_5200t3 [Dothideomycetes sp. NU457]
MVICSKKTLAGIIAGSVSAGLLLLSLPVLLAIKHRERRERRRAEKYNSGGLSSGTETKTVTVENRGPLNGIPGTAEVVTTGPTGTSVTAVSTSATGSAVVSTSSAGVPGSVTVDQGRSVTVTAEHPVGKPEQATVVQTVQT